MSQLAAVALERVVAVLPAECVDDDIARTLVSCACFIPQKAAVYCKQKGIVCNDEVQQYVSMLWGLSGKFNKEYVRAMLMDDTQSVSRAMSDHILLWFMQWVYTV